METSMSNSQRIFLQACKRKKFMIHFFQIFLFLVFIVLWEVLAYLQILDPFIFSSPSRMWNCLLELSQNGSLFYHIFITLFETFISFLLVTLLSIILAVLLWWNDILASIAEPYLVVLNSLPKTALAPVFIIWLGNNIKTIIIAGLAVAVFGSIITLYTQFRETEEEKIKLILTLGGTKKDVLRYIILPGNIPAILSNMKVNIGLSLVGVIIGEFLAANAGLGYLIIYGSQVFKLDYVMLSICILCIVATGLYKLLGFFEKTITRFVSHQ